MKLTLCLLIFAAAVLGQDAAPFACNLKVFQAGERKQHIKLTHDIMSAVIAAHELPRGYAFQIDPERVSLLELSEWAGARAKVLPVFRFSDHAGWPSRRPAHAGPHRTRRREAVHPLGVRRLTADAVLAPLVIQRS